MRYRYLLLLFAVVLLAAGVSLAQDKTRNADNSKESPRKISIADKLYKTAREKGGVAAVAEYRRLRSEDEGKYDLSEGELKRLGSQLLRAERSMDAIEILKLNVEMFPKSSGVYDSLGEAYLTDGQLGKGLVTYRKALALDPDNKNAAEIVKRLEKAGIKEDTKLAKPPKESDEEKTAGAKAVELLKREGKLYDSYVGKYQFLNSHLLITKKGDKLYVQFPPLAKRELERVSDTEFSISPIDSLTFRIDADLKVTGVTLKHHVHKVFAKKVD